MKELLKELNQFLGRATLATYAGVVRKLNPNDLVLQNWSTKLLGFMFRQARRLSGWMESHFGFNHMEVG